MPQQIYEALAGYRKEILGWVALFAVMLSSLQFYMLPQMQKVARAESNRVLYVYYSELTQSYVAIPDKKPHQLARLEEVRNQRDKYKSFMQSDYKAGLTTGE